MSVAVDRPAEALPEKRLAPGAGSPGAYSIRLADIDERLERAALVDHEIRQRLEHIERVTTETNTAVVTLMESIRRHPLLSKFLGGK